MTSAQTINLVNDIIHPTVKQREFMRTVKDNTYILYGGAAGGGKSYILRWELVYLLIGWYKHLKLKGIRVGLFCEDYPALRDRQLSKIKMEFPEWLGSYKEATHEFILNPAFGSGVICFRNLDNPSKYLSSEFAAIAIDELTLNEQTVFDFLRMRLRWVGVEDPKLIAGTNPGSKGHMWVKNLFIDRNIPPEMQDFANKIAFVQARIDDNPYLPAGYSDALDTLPDKLRKAYREGDWNIFEGQVFEEFRTDIHIVEPFEIPKSWQRGRSMDWGYSKPYAVYEYAVDYDGVVYVINEWYGCKPGTVNTGTQETAQEAAINTPMKYLAMATGQNAPTQGLLSQLSQQRYSVATPGQTIVRQGNGGFFGGLMSGLGSYLACFVAGTEISTPEGAVAIEQMAFGDQVISLGTVNEVQELHDMGEADVYELNTPSFAVDTTQTEVFMTPDGNKSLTELSEGDSVMTVNGFEPITAIIATGRKEKVYELELTGDNMFYANGILAEGLTEADKTANEPDGDIIPAEAVNVVSVKEPTEEPASEKEQPAETKNETEKKPVAKKTATRRKTVTKKAGK